MDPSRRFNSAIAAPAAKALARVVADYGFLGVIVAAVPGKPRLRSESLPTPDCFRDHSCLGVEVVDRQHGDCMQPWFTSHSSAVTLLPIEREFCLKLDLI